MAFLERLFGWHGERDPIALPIDPAPQAYDTLDLARDVAPEFFFGGSPSRSGRLINERAAMRNATFKRAVTLNSSAIGMLPLNLFRRSTAGTIEKADAHPVHRLLRKTPNRAQTPFEFKSYMQGRALLHGDAFAYKVPGVRGVQALWPLDPLRMTPVRSDDDFGLSYQYQPKSGNRRTFKSEEIFHLRSPWSCDGLTGEGLLKLAGEVLGLADITEEAAATFLRNGSRPGGVLTHPKQLSADAIARLREQWGSRFEGPANAGRWIVAEEGMKAEALSGNGRDAEAAAHRKYQGEELARMTDTPRPLLMFDETSWGTGIEQLGLFYVTYSLAPWFVAWEEAAARDLLSETERETHYAKFNEGALLRGSLKDQAEFFSKAIGGPGAGGFMVPNEAREKMDMNPEPWGDTPAWTLSSKGPNDAA